jgi:hypothetical protein
VSAFHALALRRRADASSARMRRRTLALTACAVAPIAFAAFAAFAALAATTARDALAFGGTARELERQGTIAITNDAGFNFVHQIGHGDTTTFTLRPALDYFVIHSLSIGGAVDFEFVSGNPGFTQFSLVPEIGYDFALSDTWSFWPQADVALSFPSPGNPFVTLDFFAPFLVHPAEHFFLGIGPGFSQGLTSNPSSTLTGRFLIGGYFDH